MDSADRPHGSDPEAGFDRELDVRAIIIFGLGLAAVMIAVLVGVVALSGWFQNERVSRDPRPSPLAEANQPRLPPPPRLQEAANRDMEDLRREEEAILTSYGWAERREGIGRIPVARAIDIIATEGLPESPATAPPAGGSALPRDRAPAPATPGADRRPHAGSASSRPFSTKAAVEGASAAEASDASGSQQIAIGPGADISGSPSRGPAGQQPLPPGTGSSLAPGRDIGFDQHLGAAVPLDLEFRDESGRTVRLAEYFRGRPVVLSLAYYECPMLCGMSLQGIASSLKALAFQPGREFEIVTVSFNPREGPALALGKKAKALEFYGRPGAAGGWHFLTGDEEPIRRLTAAVGFRYAWDEEQRQYAHATGIVLLTPQGRIARYFFGIDYAPRDLRLGLVEAGSGAIGNLADSLLLLCYRYNPRTGRYSALAMGSVRTGAVLTVLGLGLFVVVMLRRERASQPSSGAGP